MRSTYLSSPSRSHPGLAQTDAFPSELRSSVVPESYCFPGRSYYEAFPKLYVHRITFLASSLACLSTSQSPHVWALSSTGGKYCLHAKCIWILMSLFLKLCGIATIETVLTDHSTLCTLEMTKYTGVCAGVTQSAIQ